MTTNGITETTVCDSKASVETALLQVNQSKYQQCNASPFLQTPLLEDFGYLHSPAVHDVLKGTYIPPPTTNPYATLLISQMATPPSVLAHPAPNPFITTNDIRASWSSAKEYTTAGKSGLHFWNVQGAGFRPRSYCLQCSSLINRLLHGAISTTLAKWH